MSKRLQYFPLILLSIVFLSIDARLASAQQADSAAVPQGPGCLVADNFFAEEVWAKVGERTCLKCHNIKGDASDSKFLLRDTASNQTDREAALLHNRKAFQRIAVARQDGKSLLLSKITGGLDHGGGVVFEADSTGYRILKRYVRRSSGLPDDGPAIANYDAPPFFDGIEMISPRRLLRRVTLSLVGRLPSQHEQAAVEKDGLQVIDTILDSVMQEEAFYERLREAFNDILLTDGYDGNAETAFSYNHFHKTRLWYQQRDPNGSSPILMGVFSTV